MNYVTTNIRVSEEDYLRLKAEAAKQRKSLSAVIREKLSKEDQTNPHGKAKKILENLDRITKKNSKYFKDIDGVEIIREMRYERHDNR